MPDWQTSQAGPFDLWPVGLGFEYFYGFVGGDTSQWAPAIVENTRPIEPPHDDPDYNFDRDMADKAIAWVRMQKAVAPDKPFLLYYATGTAHAPHHAPKEWIEQFAGKFDHGWDKQRELTFARQKELGIIPQDTQLTERSPGIDAWDSLNADQKKVFARMMEVYAAALSHADSQMERLVDAIEDMGELDNTLVIYIQGDNGASAEGSPQGLLNEMTFFNAIPEDFSEVLRRMDELGGPMTFNHYPIGWAHAMDTPFQWTKQIASHFGGTRNGLVISWPDGIEARGEMRPQFHHVIDILPTVLEAAGLEAPTLVNGVQQAPIEGVSMAYTFDDADGALAAHHPVLRDAGQPGDLRRRLGRGDDPRHSALGERRRGGGPDRRVQMGALQRRGGLLAGEEPRRVQPGEAPRAAAAVLYRGGQVQRAAARQHQGRAARREQPPEQHPRLERVHLLRRHGAHSRRRRAGPEEQVVRHQRRRRNPRGRRRGRADDPGRALLGTWASISSIAGRCFTTTSPASSATRSKGAEKLAPGRHAITVDFVYDGGGVGKGGRATLTVDGQEVASETFSKTLPFRMSLDETLDIGEDTGTPVSEDYDVPFDFTGTLENGHHQYYGAGAHRGAGSCISRRTGKSRHGSVSHAATAPVIGRAPSLHSGERRHLGALCSLDDWNGSSVLVAANVSYRGSEMRFNHANGLSRRHQPRRIRAWASFQPIPGSRASQ